MAIAKCYKKVSRCRSAPNLHHQKLATHIHFSFTASPLERVLHYFTEELLKCFLSLSSPMESSVGFIIRPDLHSELQRGGPAVFRVFSSVSEETGIAPWMRRA